MTLSQGRRTAGRYLDESEAARLWGRLTALDFFGNSFQLASLAILCFFPFLIVVSSAAGRNAAEVLSGWLALDQQAAQAVATLFAPEAGFGTLTLASAFLLVLGAMAIAGVLQQWYARVFEVPGAGWRRIVAQLCWLATLLAYGAVQTATGRLLGGMGGPVLQGLAGLALATLFWWWSMYVLLVGAIRWRVLLPSALATGVCWVGLGAFSAHFFSDAIVSGEQNYGAIGVMMIILSWLVAVGVVIHLGSVVGGLYVEHRAAGGDQREGRRA
ncbi:ribonuclease BN [Streptomyces sp. NPDC127084]|uniref:ribonuclease BN n=1 Tax=Streptomyces sp. NPDC127084 TaxID=3347133 RepID=UPI00364E1A70